MEVSAEERKEEREGEKLIVGCCDALIIFIRSDNFIASVTHHVYIWKNPLYESGFIRNQ